MHLHGTNLRCYIPLVVMPYHLPLRGSITGTPSGSPREPMGNDTDLLFVFPPAGKGSCLVLETTLPNRGDIPTGFVRGNATGKVKSALYLADV